MTVKSEQKRYHHGNLGRALLEAAERILDERTEELTLRRVARAVGVSHAAPNHHFGSLAGLLSALAADGFERLAADMREEIAQAAGADSLEAMARSYVGFARRRPGLFRLMFSADRLVVETPRLQRAARGLLDMLQQAFAGRAGEPISYEQALAMARAWSEVHGFAQLLVDGQFAPLVGRIAPQMTEEAFVAAALGDSGSISAVAPAP